MKVNNFEIDIEKLYLLAKNMGEAARLENDFYMIKNFLESNYEIKFFFESLYVPNDFKLKTLKERFPAFSRLFWEILSFLIDRDSISFVPLLSDSYTRCFSGKENIEIAELIFSQNAPKDVIDSVYKHFKNISFKILVDPSILGGFIIRKSDGTVIDGSLKGRLMQMKRGLEK